MHILQEKIPYLFAIPSPSDRKIGLLSSYALLIIAIFWIALGSLFDRGSYYLIPIIALLAHGYLTMRYARNILFLFRYGLIMVLGLGAAAAWSFKTEVFIAPFGASYQSHEATVALVGSILLAVAGSSFGWYSKFGCKRLHMQSAFKAIAKVNFEQVRRVTLIFAVLIALVFVYRSGGIISETKFYASGGNDLGFEFGAFNAFFFFFTSAFFLSSRLGQSSIKNNSLLLLSLYVLPILTGSRADFLMQGAIFGFVVFSIYWFRNNARYARYPLFLIIFGVALLYFLSQFVGVWRHVGDLSVALTIFGESFSFLSDRSAGTVLSLSTGNQMAGHFYAVYAKLESLGEPYLLGSSYFDFILRTPPGFLGLPRPEDLAWQMEVAGESMAQGGIFEVAEAYWNFWFFGAFFVPLIITRLLAWFLVGALTSRRHWFFFASSYVSLMLMSPRGIWYQTFAYWRVFTVIAVIYLAVSIIRTKQANHAHHNTSSPVKKPLV